MKQIIRYDSVESIMDRIRSAGEGLPIVVFVNRSVFHTKIHAKLRAVFGATVKSADEVEAGQDIMGNKLVGSYDCTMPRSEVRSELQGALQ